MLKTFDILPPRTIVDRFKKVSQGQQPKPIANALWQSFQHADRGGDGQLVALAHNAVEHLEKKAGQL